jgi:hypothetical protein
VRCKSIAIVFNATIGDLLGKRKALHLGKKEMSQLVSDGESLLCAIDVPHNDRVTVVAAYEFSCFKQVWLCGHPQAEVLGKGSQQKLWCACSCLKAGPGGEVTWPADRFATAWRNDPRPLVGQSTATHGQPSHPSGR